jgi:hypothetical protein
MLHLCSTSQASKQCSPLGFGRLSRTTVVTAQTSVQVFLQEELVKESPNGLTESLIALLSSLTVSKTVLCVRRTSVLASSVSAPRFWMTAILPLLKPRPTSSLRGSKMDYGVPRYQQASMIQAGSGLGWKAFLKEKSQRRLTMSGGCDYCRSPSAATPWLK